MGEKTGGGITMFNGTRFPVYLVVVLALGLLPYVQPAFLPAASAQGVQNGSLTQGSTLQEARIHPDSSPSRIRTALPRTTSNKTFLDHLATATKAGKIITKVGEFETKKTELLVNTVETLDKLSDAALDADQVQELIKKIEKRGAFGKWVGAIAKVVDLADIATRIAKKHQDEGRVEALNLAVKEAIKFGAKKLAGMGGKYAGHTVGGAGATALTGGVPGPHTVAGAVAAGYLGEEISKLAAGKLVDEFYEPLLGKIVRKYIREWLGDDGRPPSRRDPIQPVPTPGIQATRPPPESEFETNANHADGGEYDGPSLGDTAQGDDWYNQYLRDRFSSSK